jgi:hypothetical protein
MNFFPNAQNHSHADLTISAANARRKARTTKGPMTRQQARQDARAYEQSLEARRTDETNEATRIRSYYGSAGAARIAAQILATQPSTIQPERIDWTRPIADQGHAAHRTIAADAEAKARARHPGHEPPHHVEADRAHDHPKATTANQPTPALQPPTTASD